jgi:tRNA pseudouridine55 synthase
MPRLPLDGVVLLDKPTGLSSAAAVARVRRAFNAAKAGHTGTLDPLASGLLPLCLGEATKFASDLLEADKSYRATIRLGSVTTTGDAEGEVLERHPVDLDAEQIEAALSRLRGPIEQVPPMYSALKRDGRPLYELARAGIEVERAARRVTIHQLELVCRHADDLEVDVSCSKGTYIRVLALDLGALLGCGAHLAGLRRTRVGALAIEQAIDLASLEALDEGKRRALLRPLDQLVQACPIYELDALASARFCQGQRLALSGAPTMAATARVRVYDRDAGGRFLGMAEIDAEGVLHPRRLVVPPNASSPPHDSTS